MVSAILLPMLKSFVYTSTDGLEVVHRVQARDLAHATEKMLALFPWSEPMDATRLVSHADFRAEREATLEPLYRAPWQLRLSREERRNLRQLC